MPGCWMLVGLECIGGGDGGNWNGRSGLEEIPTRSSFRSSADLCRVETDLYRLVHSHRMIGVFRMIILLTGQIILRTRMIGRDDPKGKTTLSVEFSTSGKA